MKQTFAYLFVFLFISFFVSISQALTNSVPAVDGKYNNMVWIQTNAVSDDGDSAIGFCNATLLSPRVMVTAAHCVASAIHLRDYTIEFRVGRYYWVKRHSDGQMVRVGWKAFLTRKNEPARFLVAQSLMDKIQRQGAKTKVSINEDYALIVLQNPIDLEQYEVTPAQVIPQSLLPRLKNLAALSPTISSINLIAENSTDTRRTAQLNAAKLNGNVLESKSVARVEPGDSGAPLSVTIDGKSYVIGVTKGRGENIFTNWDGFALLDQRLCALATANGISCTYQ